MMMRENVSKYLQNARKHAKIMTDIHKQLQISKTHKCLTFKPQRGKESAGQRSIIRNSWKKGKKEENETRVEKQKDERE